MINAFDLNMGINTSEAHSSIISDVLSAIHKNSCQIKVNEVINNYGKKKYYIHIAISPIKNHDRLE